MKTTLLCLFLCLAKVSFSQEFLNLDFEYEIRGTEIPKKWYIETPGYIAKMDETEKYRSERSLMMTSNSPAKNQFAIFTGNFPVTLAKGRSIEFTGHVKTESVTNGYAGLWWSVDGEAGVLGFDNMEKEGLTGTNDWQEVSIRINVDKNATDVTFGGLLTGLGTAWFDDFDIRIDGKRFEDLPPRVTAPTMEELEWLQNNVYPLSTYDPANKSDKDLEIMDSLIGDTHVVGLGEVTHGSSEIFQMKHRIIRFLAEKKNFGIFSMEANMPEAYRLNDYIISGKKNPTELIKDLGFWTWSTREVLNMVEWMKLYNTSKKQIQFTGFDMQFYDLSIKELEKKFKNHPTALDDLIAIKQLLDKTSNQHRNSRLGAISQEDKDTVYGKLSRVREAIKKLKITRDRMAWLHQNVRIIEQYMDKTIFSRDKFMAENLMWIRSQNPGSKIVVWAHNAHIQKTMHGMGNFLSDSLAKDYVSVGFAFARGTYTAMGSQGLTEYQSEEPYNGTFERFFEAIDTPFFIIDLRSVKTQKPTFGKWLLEKLDFRQVGVMKLEREFYETDLSEDYDLIIFIRDSSGSEILD